jgi:hypothetical protein
MTVAETVYRKLRTAPPEMARQVLDFLEFLEGRSGVAPDRSATSWEAFDGVLRGSVAFARDPVQIQRDLRSEWDDTK